MCTIWFLCSFFVSLFYSGGSFFRQEEPFAAPGPCHKSSLCQLYRPPSVSRLGTKRILTAELWVPCRVSCRKFVASEDCVHSAGRGWAVILIHITGRSSRQRYAPQRFVHALRALLHKPLFRYAPRLNSSVSAKRVQNPKRRDLQAHHAQNIP